MANAWRMDRKEQGKLQDDHLGRFSYNLEKRRWHGPGWEQMVEVVKSGWSLYICQNESIRFPMS